MIDSAVRIGARSLPFGASEYRAIVIEGDLDSAKDQVSYYRHLADRCTSLRYLDICAAAYWASIVDAITARQS
jgi:hypothetical protein